MASGLSIGVLITLGLSLLLNLVALGAPNWNDISSRGITGLGNGYKGLFKQCLEISLGGFGSKTICNSIGSGSNWLNAVRAMLILSMLLVAVGLILIILSFVKETFKTKTFMRVVAGMAIVAALFVLIAVSVYAALGKGRVIIPTQRGVVMVQSSLAWAFYVAIIHLVFNAIAGGLAALLAARTDP